MLLKNHIQILDCVAKNSCFKTTKDLFSVFMKRAKCIIIRVALFCFVVDEANDFLMH